MTQKRLAVLQSILHDNYTQHFSKYKMIVDYDAERMLARYFPNDKVLLNQEALCVKVLEPFAEVVRREVHVLSGYRCKKANRNIKGSSRDHETGEAADIRVSSMQPGEMAMVFLKSDWPFDRIIIAYPNATCGGWLHVSHKRNGHNSRKMYIKYDDESPLRELNMEMFDLRSQNIKRIKENFKKKKWNA